jgi:predicted TIM-barrel fold metal-dependent hydrolase
MKNVYFDACGIAISGRWEGKVDLIVKRIHQIGINRILYGSDGAVPGNLPKDALERWRQLPLKKDEFRLIENNIAPYVRGWLKAVRAN